MSKKNEKTLSDSEIIDKLKSKYKRFKLLTILLIIVILLFLFHIFGLGMKFKNNVSFTSGDVDEDYIYGIRITDDDLEMDKNERLNIFDLPVIDGDKVISPNDEGTYRFYIENKADAKIQYNMLFSNENSIPINLMYRLKINNIYIRGDEEHYVSINDIDVNDIVTIPNAADIYTLEWKWVDDKSDTSFATTGNNEYYNLNLKINAYTYED